MNRIKLSLTQEQYDLLVELLTEAIEKCATRISEAAKNESKCVSHDSVGGECQPSVTILLDTLCDMISCRVALAECKTGRVVI